MEISAHLMTNFVVDEPAHLTDHIIDIFFSKNATMAFEFLKLQQKESAFVFVKTY